MCERFCTADRCKSLPWKVFQRAIKLTRNIQFENFASNVPLESFAPSSKEQQARLGAGRHMTSKGQAMNGFLRTLSAWPFWHWNKVKVTKSDTNWWRSVEVIIMQPLKDVLSLKSDTVIVIATENTPSPTLTVTLIIFQKSHFSCKQSAWHTYALLHVQSVGQTNTDRYID